eukprot:359613-Chlamydomonas_euryale.AAC.2
MRCGCSAAVSTPSAEHLAWTMRRGASHGVEQAVRSTRSTRRAAQSRQSRACSVVCSHAE